MKYTKYILSLMFLALLNGCIKEDMSDCPGNCILRFSYLGDGTTEIFPDKIHKVNMYVFDENGMLVSSYPVSDADVRDRETELDLHIGTYQVVTVGNMYQTEMSDEEQLNTAEFSARGYEEGERIAGNDSLYYAYRQINIPGDMQTVEETMQFVSSHYKVYVEVVGVGPDEPGGAWPALSMSGLLPMTDLENHANGPAVTYYPQTENDAEHHAMYARFNIMRHTDSSQVVLDVTDAAGNVMASVNLAQFLAEHPTIDLTLNEVLIPIRIEFKSIGAVVTVPDWYIQQVKPEF